MEYLLNKISLPKKYHNFADRKTLFGIPNAMNVLSNIAILIPFFYLLKKKENTNQENMLSEKNLLIIHILLLTIASIYYHYNPSDNTIFWDILMIATLSIIVLNIINNHEYGKLLYILSILSVIYWKYSGDIKLYLIILIGVPIYFFLKYYKNKNDTIRKYLYFTIFFTILYRIVELYDHQIYKITGNIISGHTLKHIFAGLSILYIVKLLEEDNKI